MEVASGTPQRPRWVRALVAGLAAEIALIVVAGLIYATTADAEAAMNLVVPPASFVVFIAAGYWSAKPVPGIGALQGALAGAWGVALYLALGLVASLFAKDASFTDGFTPAYLIAHALKIAGGAFGGWLVARNAATRPAS
ncbi:MAG: hypothetical protein ABIP41_03945 [Croceibacterium sp.]